MSQGTLFDAYNPELAADYVPPPRPVGITPSAAQEGARRRENAIKAVRSNADPAWLAASLDAVRAVAHRQPSLTTDDVWAELERRHVRITHEPRAMGAVMRHAESRRLIRPSDQWVLSVRPECHRRPVRVWLSQEGGPRVRDV